MFGGASKDLNYCHFSGVISTTISSTCAKHERPRGRPLTVRTKRPRGMLKHPATSVSELSRPSHLQSGYLFGQNSLGMEGEPEKTRAAWRREQRAEGQCHRFPFCRRRPVDVARGKGADAFERPGRIKSALNPRVK